MSDTMLMIISFVVLVGAFISFTREKIPPYQVALCSMVILLACGAISTNDMLGVFSNSAPITIACMFIISAALEQTGVIHGVGRHLVRVVAYNKYLGISAMFAFILIVASFINNTPVVIIMAPIVMAVAEKLKHYPSKYLIPLSYASILGGTCTLIGTSTNILVSDITQRQGLEPFTMFEITGAGAIMAVVGLLFIVATSRFLLPNRQPPKDEFLDDTMEKRFMAEAIIPHDSPYIGKALNEIRFTDEETYEVIDLVRQDRGARMASSTDIVKVTDQNRTFIQRLFANQKAKIEPPVEPQLQVITSFRDMKLEAGDRLVFKLTKDEIVEVQKNVGIEFDPHKHHINTLPAKPLEIAEGIIPPSSAFIGRRIKDLRLRRGYDCYVIAVHRKDRNITGDLPNIVLRDGDSLILEGTRENLDKFFENENILNVTFEQTLSFNPSKAPIALGTLIAVIGLNVAGFMPIAGLAMIGAVFLIMTGCVTPERAYKTIDWRVLLLIFGMLGIGAAIEGTGGGIFLVNTVVSIVGDMGPMALLISVYLLTSVMTEMITNNAVAIIITPIAIGVAMSLGYDPRPFIVAVMFAASSSFATPIGYQTNTFVYALGGYKFKDFFRIGIPMNIIIFIVAMIVIPMFWSF